jgi:hypothetical protein
MKFRLERIRDIERLRCESSRRDLARAAAAETSARDAADRSKRVAVSAAVERDESIEPGATVTNIALFERGLFSARVAKARRIVVERTGEHTASEKKLDLARFEYAGTRRRQDGLDRLRENYAAQRRKAVEKSEENNADDLFAAAHHA